MSKNIRLADLKIMSRICKVRRDVASQRAAASVEETHKLKNARRSAEEAVRLSELGYHRELSGAAFRPELLNGWKASLEGGLGKVDALTRELSVAEAEARAHGRTWSEAFSRLEVVAAAERHERRRSAKRRAENLLSASDARWHMRHPLA